MFSKIGRSISCALLALGIAPAAHADTVYPFNRSTTVHDVMTATGSISANQAGTNLPPTIITDWNIAINGLTLTPSNSTLTFQPGTIIDAALNLTVTAPTSSDGFILAGTATDGQDSFVVQWVFGNGPEELMSVAVPGGTVIAAGINPQNTYPVTFATDTVGATPPPVPEPSTFLLLGTGSLAFALASLRRFDFS